MLHLAAHVSAYLWGTYKRVKLTIFNQDHTTISQTSTNCHNYCCCLLYKLKRKKNANEPAINDHTAETMLGKKLTKKQKDTVLSALWSSALSAGVAIYIVSIQNLLAPFFCVLGKDTFSLFYLFTEYGFVLWYQFVYQFVCHCDSRYVGRTSQRLEERNKQHVSKSIANLPASPNRQSLSRSCKANRRPQHFHKSSIGQHLLDNAQCALHYNNKNFSILARGRSSFHLSALEATFIKSVNPLLCKPKEFVYSLKIS